MDEQRNSTSDPDKLSTQPQEKPIQILEKCEVERQWLKTKNAKRASEIPSYFADEFDRELRHAMEKCEGDEQVGLRAIMGWINAFRNEQCATFIRSRGKRYEGCRAATFTAETDEQKAALESMRSYAKNIDDNVADGKGMILFGPKGTGKDHLAVAMARHAIFEGYDVAWVNGMDLYGEFRDTMRRDANRTEEELVESYINRQILYISDPLPPAGTLTDYQNAVLFRILDGRYSDMRPTWVTVNVSSAAELDSRLGASNGDRLRHDALAIFFNWGSHRKVAT